jgi:flavin-dependent dehydrogenase
MYDAIIVGARCAGSPTAMLLARKGYRILLVDKATFPSDTISTHILWPHGAALMDRWGLLDRLAATGCPPTALRLIFVVGPFALKGRVVDTSHGRGGFCPRRTVLDKLVVDAAAEAGAEVREGLTVVGGVADERPAGTERLPEIVREASDPVPLLFTARALQSTGDGRRRLERLAEVAEKYWSVAS